MVNRSLEKLAVCDDERPVAIQIYGKEPGPVADAARIVVERARPDVLDLNFGCPVKRVAGKGAGAGMLQNIPKMLEITRAWWMRGHSRHGETRLDGMKAAK